MSDPLDRDGMNILQRSLSDPKYGCSPENRNITSLLENGVVALDKPRGPTSHQVVSWLKDILGIEKAGHHGTLDPNTTGVLPIALGNGVKLLDPTLTEGKEYIAIMHLHGEVSGDNLKSIIADYTGEIYQMVPVRSAVKRGLRTRRIHYLKLIERDGNNVLVMIGCESGTYIRTLIHDMGEVLGVGANMAELRRSRSGKIHESQGSTLQELKDAWELYKEKGVEDLLRAVIHPHEELVSHLPCIIMKDTAVDAICHGAPIGMPGIAGVENGIEKSSLITLLTLKGEIIGLANADMGTKDMKRARSGQAAHLKRVIMAPGTYPRSWKSRSNEQE